MIGLSRSSLPLLLYQLKFVEGKVGSEIATEACATSDFGEQPRNRPGAITDQ